MPVIARILRCSPGGIETIESTSKVTLFTRKVFAASARVIRVILVCHPGILSCTS
jgi:hypothetical protein